MMFLHIRGGSILDAKSGGAAFGGAVELLAEKWPQGPRGVCSGTKF